jgi:hypothetical protein
MNKLHAEYRRRRAAGWTAKQAWDAAHTAVAFEAEAEAGRVRFRVLRDEDPDPDPFAGARGLRPSEERREHERIVRMAGDWGVWGIVSEVKCPCCGRWVTVDSVWGFLGNDWRDSAYDTDVMQAALDKLGEVDHGSN